jgi:capsid protein
MLGSELQTAKRASKQYANVYRKDAVTDYDNPTTLTVSTLPENSVTGGDGTGGTEGEPAAAKNYENLELYTGGFTDYLDKDDRVEFPPVDRPNANLSAFMDAINGQSGSALGMAFAYTRMRADSSYTAVRGDMIMTWVTFRWLQKWLERTVCDWVAVRVLTWAQRKGLIKPLPEGWQTALSWMWPKMPEVNEGDAQKAIAEALKNGTTDYSEQLGPDWRKRLEGFSEMIDFIREKNMPLGILEGKSGGQAGVSEPANTDNTKGATK